MNIFRSRFLMVASLAGTAGLLMNVNCGGSSGGGTGGSGGTTSTGGKGGTGTGGKGGGTGGTSTGGTAGSGTGGAATGGTAGSGTGGSAGAKGGNGGANTDGGTQQFAAFSYTFDTQAQGTEGFTFNNFNGSGGNLVDVDGGTAPTLAWDGSVGQPNPGSLKVTATFTDYGQFVNTSLNVQPSLNLAGKMVHAFVMVDAIDGGPNFTGFAQVAVNAIGNNNANNSAGLTPGVWKEIVLTIPAASSTFDPTQIIQFSVLFGSGTRPEGGAFGGPVHATFHIDSITDGSGLPAAPAVNYTFDTSTEDFSIGGSVPTPDGGTAPAVTWDSLVGNPSPGSLKEVVEFRGYNENWSVSVNPQPFVNLTGKTLHAKIMMDTGGALPAGTTSNYIQLHASSGSGFVYANSGTGASFTSTSAGTWIDLTFDLANPQAGTSAAFDPSQISQIGVQVGINSGPDGGVFPTPAPVTFHIDSIVAQ